MHVLASFAVRLAAAGLLATVTVAPVFAGEGGEISISDLPPGVVESVEGGSGGMEWSAQDITVALTREEPVPFHVQFELGSSDLSPEAKRQLDEVAVALQAMALKDKRFEIAGHTDDIGDEELNMRLSEQRAESSRLYLVEAGGVDGSRLMTIGHGEYQPEIDGTTEEARARNRRVVLGVMR